MKDKGKTPAHSSRRTQKSPPRGECTPAVGFPGENRSVYYNYYITFSERLFLRNEKLKKAKNVRRKNASNTKQSVCRYASAELFAKRCTHV